MGLTLIFIPSSSEKSCFIMPHFLVCHLLKNTTF